VYNEDMKKVYANVAVPGRIPEPEVTFSKTPVTMVVLTSMTLVFVAVGIFLLKNVNKK
jgi:hypothetical protein